MPNVTATPRSLRNGEVITEFTDTTSTTNVTYTYPLQQSGTSIENSGVADIFVTVGNYTNQVVKPNKTWKADVTFTAFSIRSDVNSQEFTATAFQNDIEGSGEADSVARGMISNINAQLADTTRKFNTSTPARRPLVVFISDDTAAGDYTVVAPIFDVRGVPCNFACITGRTDTTGALTSAQLVELNSRGHGIMSHTHNHLDLSTMTESEIETDFINSQAKLREILGHEVTGLAYPYGVWDERVVKIARKYFTHAYATVNEGYQLNDHFLDQYVIPRDVITYGTGATPRPLDTIKLIIDKCKAEGKLLVFCIHASEFLGDYTGNVALLESVIDYIKSIDVDIVDYNTAINEKGNILDIGTFKTNYYKVGSTGVISTNELAAMRDIFDKVARNFNTPLTDYPIGMTYTKINSTDGIAFPEGVGGLLVTYNVWADTEMNFQIWYPQNSSKQYKRYWHKFSLVWKVFTSNLIGVDAKNIAVTGFDMIVVGQQAVDVDVPGAVTGSRVIATPRVAPPSGILVDCTVPTANKVRLRFFNARGSVTTVPNMTFDISVITG